MSEWEKVMAVNTTGVFISTKLELQQMVKQDSIAVYDPFPLYWLSIQNDGLMETQI